ncbi:hypothetical protein MNEG_13180 [Monoraphidium neglectum]|uniref:5'-Nucleotidase C-terminal domain-containing protein n=1 Tax=Monoraphidium neglectum TaxID=145388 RepID=A0A0D2KFX4_9CHLO|nr:hypothetical protein MNEG_13180 [Monoraphidium neglectum]KIY94783.1 hypothetical protein MNEG_13180 [Monoraphidium neglectum]|eukprot:XP_013893803.1 hypothetical protein MNEG_13180 [Monoraphidium neglectum]
MATLTPTLPSPHPSTCPPDHLNTRIKVAGVRVFHQGNDLVDAKIILANGSSADIDPKAKYNVATLDYISNGGDGFFDFKEAPSLLLNGNEVGDIMMHDLEKAMPNPIKVPDVTKTRRIINCAADYVSCANPLYAPCCKSKQGASKAAPSPSPKPSARR